VEYNYLYEFENNPSSSCCCRRHTAHILDLEMTICQVMIEQCWLDALLEATDI